MTGLLILVLFVHLLYYLFLFVRLVSNDAELKKEIKPISIVVCFKNEEKTVEVFLKKLLVQKIDDIVLVDDFSIDKTFEKLSAYQSETVQVIRASSNRPGKKQAVNDGIASAKYDRILFTDADCIPGTSDWSIIMNSTDKPIVLGYSPMKKTQGLANLFARF